MASPVSKNFTCWEIPGLYSKSVNSFRNLIKTIQSIVQIGAFFGSASDYFRPLSDTLRTTADYLGATKTFTNIAAWIPDEKGQIPAFKTKGNWVLKGFGTVSSQISDTIATVKFLDKLKVINLANTSAKLGSSLSNVKNSFGIAASVFGLVDTGVIIFKTAEGFKAHHLVFDPIGLFFGNGLIHPSSDAPQDINQKKHIDNAYKNIRDIALSVLFNALKITLLALSIVGMAASIVTGFVGLAMGVVGITSTVIKGYESKPDPQDPKTIKAWELVESLNIPIKA